MIEEHQPDVVLLDIRMPGMDGVEAARHISQMAPPPAIIFTTAYDEHALAAFDASATDYLLKPIRTERLRAALEKASLFSDRRNAGVNDLSLDGGPRTHLSGLVQGNLVLVPVEKILFFQADQGYTRMVWEDGELLIEDSLKQLEDELF